MEKQLDIYYFSGTHWDREWYQDFQGFRFRLVRMIDNLIKLFENDRGYKTFHFDGQTIVLEDYLEIRSEQKEKLAELIENGEILIGPWYVMPDEFLVSGESLIRNLMLGHKIAREWNTDAWKYGYICDIFGHIAQMPQIFRGFSIKYAALGRGLTEEDPTYFKWQAPNGDECYTFKLESELGYGSFKALFYDMAEDKSAENPETRKRLKEYVDSEIKRSGLPIVVLMDGLDHAEASVNTTGYIKALRELYPNARVHHINLCEQGSALEKYSAELPIIRGELVRTAMRQHNYLHLITNTLSSYYPLKQRNDNCQSRLEKTVEPMCVFAMLDGKAQNRSFVKLAYRYLLKNQPHDSICGCSIDQVHKDMEYRFDQIDEICTALEDDYIYDERQTDTDKFGGIIKFYNMLPFELDKTVTVDIPFRRNSPYIYSEPFRYEDINSFRIYGCDGNEIPYIVRGIKRNMKKRIKDQYCIECDIHTVTMRVKMPPCGSSEYKIVPSSTPVRHMSRMTAGTNYVENDFVRVTILENGNIELYDKKTDRTYSNLCGLVNDGEIGDGWYHASPVADKKVFSSACGCHIERVEYGPQRCVFKVTRYMEVPKEMKYDEHSIVRTDETTVLKIVMYVGLSEENRYADIKMEYENTAKDCRMRLLIPSGIQNDKYFAGQAFYCCERTVGIDFATQDWRETDQYEKSTNGIVGKRAEDGCGIAFVAKSGLHECAAFGDTDGTLAVTLSRSFRTTVMTNGETRCQLNRKLDYDFVLAPIDREVGYTELLKIKDKAEYNVLYSFIPTEECVSAAAPKSHMRVTGSGISVSCIKCAEGDENAVIVRVFNSSGAESRGRIEFERGVLSADFVNLNEEYISAAECDENGVEIKLKPWEIKTYLINMK